ncbi:hypothetical protein CQA41_04995 [Klebsiella pneumoniae]|nr:hypothetical protein CQA41_04995 [Klebsiella pneumoniae]
MLIGLGDGVEDGHGGQNVGCDRLCCVYLLFCIISASFFRLIRLMEVTQPPPKDKNQANYGGAKNCNCAAHF